MRKIFLILVLIFGFAGLARAQQKQVLSAAATTCTTTGTSCLINSVDPGIGGMTFTVSANSGNTLQFEASGDGGQTWVAFNVTPSNSSTAASSTTSTGTWQGNVAGYTNVRIRMSTFSSGTSTVSIISSFASARSGGGGGGTVTNVTGTAPIVSSGGATPAISCSTCMTGNIGNRQIAFGSGTGTGLLGDSVFIYDTSSHTFQLNAPNVAGGTTPMQVNNSGVAGVGNGIAGAFTSLPAATGGNSSGNFFGLQGNVNVQAGAGNYTGTIASFSTSISHGGSGVISNAYGMFAQTPTNSGGGSLTNVFGFFAANQNGLGGTLTAAFNAAAQTAGTNNYGFFSDVTNKDHFGAASLVSLSCGTLNTTACVITGFGSTSGTATLTWPAVAGTTTNPIVSSNILQAPQFLLTSTSGLQPSGGTNVQIEAGGSGSALFSTTAVTVFVPLNFGGSADTGLSRDAAGVVDVGNGAQSDVTGTIKPGKYATGTNCAGVGTSASPSVASCGSAAAGHFSCATNATGATCQVNTTAVTANSEIFVFESDTTVTGTALGVTCNTSTTVNPATRLLASSVAATSFTINLGTVTTNPACFSYHIIN